MEAFKLDTSGEVQFRDSQGELMTRRWSGLSPFEQGYVEAALRDIQWPDPAEGHGPSSSVVHFDWIAPEALARIIADCAAAAPDGGLNGYPPTNASAVADARGAGAEFWRRRNKFTFKRFPPLTPTLSDDGLIYFREQA